MDLETEPDVLGELSAGMFDGYFHGNGGGVKSQLESPITGATTAWAGDQQQRELTTPVLKPLDLTQGDNGPSHLSFNTPANSTETPGVESQSVFPNRVYKKRGRKPTSKLPTMPSPGPGYSGESLQRNDLNSLGASDRAKQILMSGSMATPAISNATLNPYVCSVCEKSFPTPLKLRQHLACHALEKTFVCDLCGRGFARKQTLTRHIMHRHVTEKPHVCPICSKGYPQKYLLKQHLLKHTEEEQRQFNCETLETVQIDYAALISSALQDNSKNQDSDPSKDGSETSREKSDGEASQSSEKMSEQAKKKAERPHVCNICNKRFAEKVILDQHMINHTVGKPYKCNLCDTEFILHRSLVKHCMTVHLGDKPFVCEVCNQAFGKTSTLKRHMFTHSKVKPHACNVCGRAFTREYSLQLHMANHTGDKPFKCGTCGKGFASNSRLTMHFRSQHVEIAQYACGECGMTFAQEFNLKKHVAKKHTAPEVIAAENAAKDDSEEGEHKCKLCDKVFSVKSTLNRHLLMHSLERPFVCEYCDKRFTAQIGLTQHMFIHADDNPYTCEECGKGFTHRKGLQGHIMLHTGERPHVCDICGDGFIRFDSLRRHKLREHVGSADTSDKNHARLLMGKQPILDKSDVSKYFGKSRIQKAGKETDEEQTEIPVTISSYSAILPNAIASKAEIKPKSSTVTTSSSEIDSGAPKTNPTESVAKTEPVSRNKGSDEESMSQSPSSSLDGADNLPPKKKPREGDSWKA